MIIILFFISFAFGSYLLLAGLFRIPTYKARKAVLDIGKKQKRSARDADAFLMELAEKLAKVLPMDEYKKRKIESTLKSAEVHMIAEVYQAQAIVKAGLVLLFIIPCLLVVPVTAFIPLIVGVGVYITESGRADKMVRTRREEIEYELPRFVATLTQALQASRDVMRILESYQKHAGAAFRNELSITIADMATGNYEAALTRLGARVSSNMLSDVIRGLVGVIRGDDGIVFFRMLTHDMKQLELQRLKRVAMERPPKIRKFSFLLLTCMILIYMGVMGYEIVGAMSGMF